MIRLTNIKIPLSYKNSDLLNIVSSSLNLNIEDIKSVAISRRSVDARKKDDIFFIASLDVEILKSESEFADKIITKTDYVPAVIPGKDLHPIVVGAGPAGLFAAYILAQSGYNPIILERGKKVNERAVDVENFWNGGILNPKSNVQFGEGGAGTFSDGKLNTGTKSKSQSYILKTFVKMGAPDDILWKNSPHIGTDNLRNVVKNLREEIIRLGGKFLFETKMENIISNGGKIESVIAEGNKISCNSVILAVGHSARDTFSVLFENGVPMTAKPFSVGMRIEHPREFIDKAMYGKFTDNEQLGSADYRLAVHLPNGKGVYTFCMCPGGSVVAAASEPGGIVTNGMSLHSRDNNFSNSALLTDVTPLDFGEHPLDGIEFQRKIEKSAFAAVGNCYKAPAQSVVGFIRGDKPATLKNSYRPATVPCSPYDFLPDFVCDSLKSGLKLMNNKIRGFADCGCLIGPETRSSSPVRITRDDNFQSNIKGLFPCGEGSGYAGGIMSSAADGIRCAESAMKNF